MVESQCVQDERTDANQWLNGCLGLELGLAIRFEALCIRDKGANANHWVGVPDWFRIMLGYTGFYTGIPSARLAY